MNSNMIPIEEIYSIVNRDYEWEEFKYNIPRKYQSYKQSGHKSYDKPRRKTNYIDEVQKMAKKVPGPSSYKIGWESRPLSGKMGKSPRVTSAGEVAARSRKENLPGPAAYFLGRPQTAVTKRRKIVDETREHYLHEIEYLANEGPGVGTYNISSCGQCAAKVPKIKKDYYNRSVSSVKQHKGDKEDFYTVVYPGSFTWLAKQKWSKSKGGFGKMKRFPVQSKSNKVPGPNSYNINTNWSSCDNVLRTVASVGSIHNVYYS